MTNTHLDTLYRQYSQPILAYLLSLSRDLDIAQEIWHETFVIAMHQWSQAVPDNPPAWFKRTARNKFIDRFRHEKISAEKVVVLQALQVDEQDDIEETQFGDEQLKLIFACCHPALDFDKQVAMTLNTVAGLSTEQIAQSLLLSTKTLEQRLTRAKRKIKQAAIPFIIPEPKQLPERLNAVLKTLYLMFNNGANQFADPLSLKHNACMLVRRLNILLAGQAEVEGMLALMLFHQSRQIARFNAHQKIVPLSEQDRQLWQKELITEAEQTLQSALARKALGIYQIQAAIQGVHCHSQSWQETDWHEIEALYRVHLSLEDSPVVRLNGIYAMSMSRGADYALQQLLKLESQSLLNSYAPFYAVKADLQKRLNNFQAARESFSQAIALSTSPHEKSHFTEQLNNLPQD